MTDEIAVFIDFENIRYSLINVQRREPDPQELIGLARRFGTVMVARAYADWSRQPEFFKGSLTAAMIDRVDCPAKVRERFRQPPIAPMYGQPGRYGEPQSGDLVLDEQDYQDDQEEQDDQDDQDDQEEQADERDDMRGDAGADSIAEERTELRVVEVEDENGDEVLVHEESEQLIDRRPRADQPAYGNPGYYYQAAPQPVITQSTVDLNMLMDMIETVFDRPTINTFILMSGDRDFTRICARLKLRLNKRVVVVGVPTTVSRDLISAAEQFIPLGYNSGPLHTGGYHSGQLTPAYAQPQGPVDPDEPGFIQFLDYIDRHWSWRTVGGVANFIGDPFNPKNRFRGRLTRESARDLLRTCIDEGILIVTTDVTGSENLRLNRSHPAVDAVLNESAMR